MKSHGTYKLIHRARRRCTARTPVQRDTNSAASRAEELLSRVTESDARTRRIVDSLRRQIGDSEEKVEVRVRRVFTTPRSIYRLELSLPELASGTAKDIDRSSQKFPSTAITTTAISPTARAPA